jgi:hypothetical protein
VSAKLFEFAEHELHDTRLLVEKITALGGDPTTEVGRLRWTPKPGEALDHLMEHIIMRKQNQVDWLRRARREP